MEAGELGAFLRGDLGGVGGYGFDEEGHVAAEVAHGLEAFEVGFDVGGGESVDFVPVGAGDYGHGADGEVFTDFVEGGGGAGAA